MRANLTLEEAVCVLAKRYDIELTGSEIHNLLWEKTCFPLCRWRDVKSSLIPIFEEVQRGRQAEGRPAGQAAEEPEGLPR